MNEDVSVEKVLREFCRDLELCGFEWVQGEGDHRLDLVCSTNKDWPDLAMTYLKACRALNVSAKVPPIGHRKLRNDLQVEDLQGKLIATFAYWADAVLFVLASVED